jgi:hypothetical protein
VFVYPKPWKEQIKYIDKGEQEKTINEAVISAYLFCVRISKLAKRAGKIYWQERTGKNYLRSIDIHKLILCLYIQNREKNG